MKPELRTAFLVETHDLLKGLREDLPGIDRKPEALAELFRRAHMLKGDVKFAGLHELELLAGALADALKAAKERAAIDGPQAALLSEAVEACQTLLDGGKVAGLLGLIGRLSGMAASARSRRRHQAGLRVLLVEDSELQARIIQKELDECPGDCFLVRRANRLAAGLERLAHGNVDAVLLDLNLPDSQGVDTFSRLSAQAPDVPVVILTISDDDALAMEALRRGAQDYLVKSQVSSELLARVIRYAVERKRVATALRQARDELELRVRERTFELTRANESLRAKSAELERTNTELSLFASIAAHELQEPLRKIVNFGDLLKRHSASCLDQTGLRYLREMQDAAVRQGELIDSLRTLTRITTAATPMQLVDLGALAKAVAAEESDRLAQIGGRVDIGPLPTVTADRVQMTELFRNLLGNAIKYRKPQEPLVVRIESRAGPEGVGVSVADNGIGFEQEYAQKIFKPFQRLHGRGEYEGVGMGLAICARILWRHGGAISARSQLGRGSVFTFTLPTRGGSP